MQEEIEHGSVSKSRDTTHSYSLPERKRIASIFKDLISTDDNTCTTLTDIELGDINKYLVSQDLQNRLSSAYNILHELIEKHTFKLHSEEHGIGTALDHQKKDSSNDEEDFNNFERLSYQKIEGDKISSGHIALNTNESTPNIKLKFNEECLTAEEDSFIQLTEEEELEQLNNDNESVLSSTLAGTNDASVNFYNFIAEGQAYLILEQVPLPLDPELHNELKYPLGVTYDEVRKEWLICEQKTSKIVRFNTENSDVNIVENEVMKNPSAICVYSEGTSVAVLCSRTHNKDYSIYIYNLKKKNIKRFASYDKDEFQMGYRLRGLGKSFAGNLISIDHISYSENRLRVFKKNTGGAAFYLREAENPSFLATRLNTVAVSDLGSNNVYLCTLDDTDFDRIDFAIVKIIKTPQNSNRMFDYCDHGLFHYVAGLQFDCNGYLLIGDAKGNAIKLFDNDLKFLHRVSTNFGLPFMSSFHVNDAGEVMILCPRSESKIVYAKLSGVDSIQKWIPNTSVGRNFINTARRFNR